MSSTVSFFLLLKSSSTQSRRSRHPRDSTEEEHTANGVPINYSREDQDEMIAPESALSPWGSFTLVVPRKIQRTHRSLETVGSPWNSEERRGDEEAVECRHSPSFIPVASSGTKEEEDAAMEMIGPREEEKWRETRTLSDPLRGSGFYTGLVSPKFCRNWSFRSSPGRPSAPGGRGRPGCRRPSSLCLSL